MTVKLTLARLAAKAERAIDRFRRPETAEPELTPYLGYATPSHLVVRGRVLAPKTKRQTRPDQSYFANFRAMISLFRTDEMANVTVSSNNITTQSDEEGYFTLLLPRHDEEGLISVPVTIDGKEIGCPVAIPDSNAAYGIISDIDDTMIRTGAYSLWRNLWTSLSGNSTTREVFSDAVRLMQRLDAYQNPAFFVSSSPWNFYPFLTDILGSAGLPEAPMFLRDYGISDTQFITGTHGDHKGAAIDTIFAANPNLTFVLIGDTGQHDAHVYAAAAQRHPDRVRMVILREAGPKLDHGAVATLRDLNIPVHVAARYDDMGI